MAILNKRLSVAVAIKVIINRRRRRRYDFKMPGVPFSNPALFATSFQQFPVTPLWWYSGVPLSYRQGNSRTQSLKTTSCSETLILAKKNNNCALQKILLFLFSNVKLNVKNIRIFKKALRKALRRCYE